MVPITLSQLTENNVNGTGVFDSLMRAAKEHLDLEFRKGTIKGPEYSQVYLGQLQSILSASIDFLFQKEKVSLEAQLMELQIELAGVEVTKAQAQLALIQQEVLTASVQRELIEAQKLKVDAELLLVEAQTENIGIEKILIQANAAKVTAETLNVPKVGVQIEAQTALTTQQKANAILEGTVLVAQECKLQAEFDFAVQNTLKAASETSLLTQKLATEKAQVIALGVDQDSIIGRQKTLYQAQADGFKRDAEQKAAKLYIDMWSARRMTDDATQANTTNKLDDATHGQVMTKLIVGIGA